VQHRRRPRPRSEAPPIDHRGCRSGSPRHLPGRPVGGLCNAAAFNFYPSKNLGALGEGGVIYIGQWHAGEYIELGFKRASGRTSMRRSSASSCPSSRPAMAAAVGTPARYRNAPATSRCSRARGRPWTGPAPALVTSYEQDRRISDCSSQVSTGARLQGFAIGSLHPADGLLQRRPGSGLVRGTGSSDEEAPLADIPAVGPCSAPAYATSYA
jgi:DegT/DnrJ/EryC1/StrS aminotransferase family